MSIFKSIFYKKIPNSIIFKTTLKQLGLNGNITSIFSRFEVTYEKQYNKEERKYLNNFESENYYDMYFNSYGNATEVKRYQNYDLEDFTIFINYDEHNLLLKEIVKFPDGNLKIINYNNKFLNNYIIITKSIGESKYIPTKIKVDNVNEFSQKTFFIDNDWPTLNNFNTKISYGNNGKIDKKETFIGGELFEYTQYIYDKQLITREEHYSLDVDDEMTIRVTTTYFYDAFKNWKRKEIFNYKYRYSLIIIRKITYNIK